MRGIVAVALLLACSSAGRDVAMEAGGESPEELASGLNVRVEPGGTRLVLHVTNVAAGRVALEFATAQRYDFEVVDATGARVWRWSDERMFAQMLGTEVLEPGETRSYAESLPVAPGAGEYVARAVLTSLNYPVDLRTPFRLGDD